MTNIFQDYNQKKYFKNAWEQQSVDLLLPSIPVYVSLKNYAKTTIVKIFFFLCLLNYEQNGTHKKKKMKWWSIHSAFAFYMLYDRNVTIQRM